MRLAAAMCKQAVIDLHSEDPITAIDAFDWLISEGPMWIDLVLDHELPGDQVLRRVLDFER